jgi:hypothetical protein
MDTTSIDSFIKNHAKTEEQAEALRINLAFKHNPKIRTAFGSPGEYLSHIEKLEESALMVIEKNGRTEITRNTHRKMSPSTLEDAKNTWANSAQVRMEFKSFDVYRAFVEASVTGRCKILGAVA